MRSPTTGGGAGHRVPGRVLVANPSAELYGSDRMTLESIRGLHERGWQVLLTSSAFGPLLDVVEEEGVQTQVLPVPVVRRSMISPRGLLELMAGVATNLPRMIGLVRRQRPDAILVNTLTLPLWLLVGLVTRVPTIVHVHEAEASLPRVVRLALAAPLLAAQRVVFNSEVSRQVSSLRTLERAGRVRVVHNGVAGPDHPTPARSQLVEPVQVLYVGRLSARKGVDLLLRAVQLVRQRGMQVEVDVVGGVFPGYEWYEAQLRELAICLGISSAVRFHGFQQVVWPYLDATDIAVVPSRSDESFGNAVVESLLAARPVIASDHTGLREAAAGYGSAVLVPPDDADALAEALAHIIHQWPKFRAAAAEDVERANRRVDPAVFRSELAEVVQQARDLRRRRGVKTPR